MLKKKKTICGENCPNYKYTDKSVFNKLEEDTILNIADMFKIFSDSTRVKIICAILNKELSVTDICEVLNINRTTISHQLQTLRKSKLVKTRKDGTTIYYTLKDAHVEQIIMQAIDHIQE